MIKPSPELLAITRRWAEAVARKDVATLGNLFSSSEHLCYLGTSDDELWYDAVLRNGFGDHVHEIPDCTQEITHIDAFECGSTGWSLYIGSLKFTGIEHPVQLRSTLVFALEDGSWKIVHQHNSNPSKNIEVIGVEHSAMNALVDAAREGFQHEQREGMASVMFTDIANSSGIAVLMGDRAWADTIQTHLDAVTQVIDSTGGQMIKSLGDGTMSIFTSARAALSAAIEIQRLNLASDAEPQLRMRIGVHTGDVIQTKNDFFGTVVNKAARIASVAGPDEICVSDATRLMAGNRANYTFSNTNEIVLKGLSGTHTVHRLGWMPDVS
jgi:class 3 adenylate cyclase/ketosteroid isomerase-like protein